MSVFSTIRPVKNRFCRALLMLPALLFAAAAYAQKDAPNCPAPPAQPSQEKVQELAKSAKDHGFLWKLEKDGRTSYLYGSMHLNKLEGSMPGPKVVAALREADVIAFELDVLDPQIQAQMADTSKLGIKNIDLPVKQKQRLEAIAKRACAPMAALAGMHPVLQVMSISIFEARFENLEISYGSEVVLSSIAHGIKKNVVSLETPELQMRSLVPDDTNEVLDIIESGLKTYESGKQRTQFQRMHKMWSTGNINELEKYEQWCECVNNDTDRKFLKRINEDRNPGLASSIDKLHRDGKRVFAAVGALHMAGAKGIPALMREKGYKVERVEFESAGSANSATREEKK
jgi:uncharacterized protein